MNEITSGKKIFVNRTLNMNFIKLVGFDMDYTLVTYNVPAFENLVHQLVVDKLIHEKGYPNALRKLRFDPQFIVRGLVLDTELGNLLKVNCFGYVKKAAHGTRFMTFEEQKKAYNAPAIDLSDSRYYIVTTLFSLAEAHVFAQLVTLLEETGKPLSYRQIFHDIREMVDIVHQEGILKSTVLKHPDQYLYREPKIIEALQRLKANGKKLALITNSDYEYSNGAMNYCFNPYLKHPWQDLFDIIVVASSKPGFFQQSNKFLRVNRDDGHLRNFYEPLQWGGIYQGGNARTFERDLGLNPSEILYCGDHIFGDVVTLKEAIGWRTGLIL
ncbi:MAG TPA: HAD-IG family 5'-nucleotidase, partial [Candidatus Ozemobacteraceae bacterium]|nr:HAD-IG family 5'-nucleotidase [Candidatus Ozemobacteraceae bacterium]